MPRQFENWLAMTVVFGDFSTDSAAYRIEKFVIARVEDPWARAFALPVADEAKAQRVQRSARNEPALSGEVSAGYRKRTAGDDGLRAEDIRRAPQTEIRIPGI